MNRREEVLILTGLLLVTLVLTGSTAAGPPGGSTVGVVAPILALALMTWYLVLLILNREAIIEGLSAIFFRRRRKLVRKVSLVFTIIAYFILSMVIALLLRIRGPQGLGGILGFLFPILNENPQLGYQTAQTTSINPPPYVLPAATFTYYAVLVSAAIIVVSFVLMVQAFRTAILRIPPLSESVGNELREEAVQVVQWTLASLKTAKEYHETILQCYRRMCQILTDAGFAISPNETPREFAETVSAKLGIDEEAVRGLTFLFEEARYSDHQISDQKRHMAQNHLESLERSLSANVGIRA